MDIESRADGIAVKLKREEAAALADLAQIGLDVEEALGRIKISATADRALGALRKSRGSLVLTRPEAAVLIAITETARAFTDRLRFAPLFVSIDLRAAERGLDQVRGAMR